MKRKRNLVFEKEKESKRKWKEVRERKWKEVRERKWKKVRERETKEST